MSERQAYEREAYEREAYEWAVREQGYVGDFNSWLSLPADERQAYEAGAEGIGTA